MMMVLAVLLPIGFVAGIAARKPLPADKDLPVSVTGETGHFQSFLWRREGVFTNKTIQVMLLLESKDPERFAVRLSAGKNFTRPDLLVYWVPDATPVKDALPDNATLLGEFVFPVLALPPESSTNLGLLVLYSLADNEILDASKPMRFIGSDK